MYSACLTAHSLLRWAVILSGLVAAVRAWQAASPRNATGRTAAGETPRPPALPSPWGAIFTVLFDVQVLLGLILYLFLSPVTTAAMHRMGVVMSNDVLRFWTIEHPVGMLAALALAHIGRATARRAPQDPRQRRRAAIYFTLAILIVVLSAPWPFLPYGRPLLWPPV
jgi:hypothetical protein